MQEQSRRKQRTPLTPEELFYLIELKKLKQVQKLEAFKATRFFKIMNRLNVILAAFLTYCIISILILSTWEKTQIQKTIISFGDIMKEDGKRSVSEIQLYTTDGQFMIVKTDNLFRVPKTNDEIYVGKDFLFHKTIKIKLPEDERSFFTVFSYASLSISFFALVLSIFIYLVDKHLSVNGLLMCCGLFILAILYFVLI